MKASFKSKILLFGEYAIIKGGQGLAIPYERFSGKLEIGKQSDERLTKLFDYLKNSPLLCEQLDLEKMEQDLSLGLSFDSNIPQGYGVGSSGALCASIYAQYSKSFIKKKEYLGEELKLLQDYMALMESYYHGSSSGLDCLISLVDCPVHIKGRKDASVVEMPNQNELGQFYLFDSGIERKTSPLVHKFLALIEEQDNYKNMFHSFIELNNQVIQSFLEGYMENFDSVLDQLSRLQLELFYNMIPHEIKQFWREGLRENKYITKLCGAGGGGFFLIYSKEELKNPNLLML